MKIAAKLMISGIAVLLCGIASSETAYAFSKISFHLGTHSPQYGDLNDDFLEKTNVLHGTNLKLKPARIMGMAGESEISSKFSLRVELMMFEVSTSDEVFLMPMVKDSLTVYHCSVSTTPVIITATYQFPSKKFASPYVGVGLGFFPTQARYVVSTDDSQALAVSHDSPLGFQVSGGIRTSLKEKKNWFFIGEVRYTLATAHVLGTSLDWGGISLIVGVERGFG